jgi:hypothetical protein
MGLNIFIHEEKSMKKRYLNLVLVALVALFAFVACNSGGDDPPLSWPSDEFKDIGLKGLELPSGIGITASNTVKAEKTTGSNPTDLRTDAYFATVVLWGNIPGQPDAYRSLNAAIAAKIEAGVTDGKITNLTETVYPEPYYEDGYAAGFTDENGTTYAASNAPYWTTYEYDYDGVTPINILVIYPKAGSENNTLNYPALTAIPKVRKDRPAASFNLTAMGIGSIPAGTLAFVIWY